jgi:tartrate-resistant acid phosphatase type 5
MERDEKDANTNGVEMYYEGQGFMSMEINETNLRAIFYDIEGNAIHKLEMSKNHTNFLEEEK